MQTNRRTGTSMTSTFPLALRESITVQVLCQLIGNCRAFGDLKETLITSISSPETAIPGSIVFLVDCDQERLYELLDQGVTVVVATESLESDWVNKGCQITTSDPRGWFIKAISYLHRTEKQDGWRAPSAIVSSNAQIGEKVRIGEGVVIEDSCHVGDGVYIGSNTILKGGTEVQDGCYIQSGCVIGGIGLGYHFTESGERLLLPHLGKVIIESDAVIGSSCVIVRGQLSDTRIGRRTRLGNLVNIGHNVTIGADCAISSSSCIAGGAKLGNSCNLGVGVKVNAKVELGDFCQVGIGSVVTKSLEGKKSYFGVPAKCVPTMRRF